MKKLKKELLKYFTFRNVIFLLILLLVSFLWFKYLAGMLLIILFVPLTAIIIRYSRMIPHITADPNMAMSIFMGFLFGPVFGFLYGLIAGTFAYVINSFVKLTSLNTILLSAIAGLLGGIFQGFDISFSYAFLIIVIIRTVIAWPLFSILGVDPVENTTHQGSQMLVHLIVYYPLFTLLYSIIVNFL